MSSDAAEDQGVQVGNLLAGVKRVARIHEAAKNLYHHRLAPDYSVFDFIEPNEMRLSSIFAWLLDPKGSHGQGTAFLETFLKQIGIEAESEVVEQAYIRREVSVDFGRLDILIALDGLRIVIENKPWAAERNNQIEDYFSYLKQANAPQFCLVYFSGTGVEPSSVGREILHRWREAKQFINWSFASDIPEWLLKCRSVCRADRISSFLDEFISYLRATFEGLADTTMSTHIVDEVISSPENLESAVQILALGADIRKAILAKLVDQLRKNFAKKEVNVFDLLEGNEIRKYAGLTIEFQKGSQYDFCLEFERVNCNDLIFGICRKPGGIAPVGDEKKLVNEYLGYGRETPGFLWYQNSSRSNPLLPVDSDWQFNPQPWLEISSGALASKITQAYWSLHAVLARADALMPGKLSGSSDT